MGRLKETEEPLSVLGFVLINSTKGLVLLISHFSSGLDIYSFMVLESMNREWSRMTEVKVVFEGDSLLEWRVAGCRRGMECMWTTEERWARVSYSWGSVVIRKDNASGVHSCLQGLFWMALMVINLRHDCILLYSDKEFHTGYLLNKSLCLGGKKFSPAQVGRDHLVHKFSTSNNIHTENQL